MEESSKAEGLTHNDSIENSKGEEQTTDDGRLFE